MSDIKLLPCPFCGGEAELNGRNGEYYVDCNLQYGNCACIPTTWGFETEEEAIEAWNTRNPIERIVKKLEEKADEAHDRYNPVIAQTFRRAIEIVKAGGKDEGIH